MYAFLILAAWRVLIELSARLARWRIAFLIAGVLAVSALLYQGKTGGELVYQHGVGVAGSHAISQDAGILAVPENSGHQEALVGSAPRRSLPADSGKR